MADDNQQPQPLEQPSLSNASSDQPSQVSGAMKNRDSTSQDQPNSTQPTSPSPGTAQSTEDQKPTPEPVITASQQAGGESETTSPKLDPPSSDQTITPSQPSEQEPQTQPLTPAGPPPPSTSPPPAESPEVKPPEGGKNIKKLLFIFVGIIAVVASAFLIITILLPRLRGLKLPGLPGKEVTLTYWGLWEPNSVMQAVISEFEEQNPEVTIEYNQQNHKEYRERLQSALARNEGPDIFRFHNTWVPMLKEELDQIPASIYSASEFESTFYPVAANDLRLGASYVGIPLEIDGLALLYNKKIFTSAGKKVPTTWEELRKTAFDLTLRDSNGSIQTAGAAVGMTSNIDHWPDILALMMFQNGANLNNPSDKLASDALQFFTLFTRSDKVWDETLPNSTQAFASGKVAMIFAPSWRILEIKALNPELDFGVLPVPLLPNTNVTWASYWVEGVSNKSENTEEAWKFLKFLSSKETLEKLYQAAVSERLIGEPYSRKDMSTLLQDDPWLGVYIRQAPAAKSWYLSSNTYDNGINDRIIKYFEDAVNAVNSSGVESQAALTTTSQGVSQVLSQYQLQ